MLHLQKIYVFGTATIIKTHRINNYITFTARHIVLKNCWFCFFHQHLPPPKKLWILFNKWYVPYNVPNTHYNSSCNKQALIQLHCKIIKVWLLNARRKIWKKYEKNLAHTSDPSRAWDTQKLEIKLKDVQNSYMLLMTRCLHICKRRQ